MSKFPENEIIELYNSGKSMKQIGDIYGTSAATIMRILHKNSVPVRTKGGIYALPESEIIEMYKAGTSGSIIAEKFNVTFNTIQLVLKKHGIKMDNRYHNLTLNRHYWETIDSYDKAYFLGFMITDGNVRETLVRLELKSDDIEILETFCQKTGNSNKVKIYYREDKKSSTALFNCKDPIWVKDLAQYGVVPRKTSTAYLPILEPDLMPHLIRGMIDGDGCVCYKSHYIQFCGNQETVAQFRDFLVDTLGVYNVKIRQTEPHLWSCQWSGIDDVRKIGNYIYKDKKDCYLKRKFDNFIKI